MQATVRWRGVQDPLKRHSALACLRPLEFEEKMCEEQVTVSIASMASCQREGDGSRATPSLEQLGRLEDALPYLVARE
jgi:hypothetical protein